ncbi:hypothetical protein [Mycolicibacterium sp.]|uniref:hypothetical protein n=1 Tax=Mycolicibacterium sp. TaxID=2320850 RepID=UPI003D0C4F8E
MKRLAGLLAAGILVLSACGSQPEAPQTQPAADPSEQTSSTAAAPTAATATTSTTAPPPPPITGDALSGSRRALGTIYQPCSPGDTHLTVFDPATGRMVTTPTMPAIPKGTEAWGGGNSPAHCALTGTPDDLKVLYVYGYRKPSEGLNPESFHAMAAVASIHDTEVTQIVELPPELGVPSEVIPTDGGPVLAYCCRGRGAVVTAALDPNTLAVRWTSDQGVATHDHATVAFDGVRDGTVTIRDVASGADTVVENVTPASTNARNYRLDSGYVLEQRDGSGNTGYYSTLARQFYPNILVDDDPELTPVINEGRLLLKGDKSLKVVDITNGATVFELGEAELEAVDSYQFATSGDYLYIANSSDSPVIDMRDRQKVSSGWRVRPLNTVGGSWVLVNHRANDTRDCYEGIAVFDCESDEVTLEKFPDGKYPGPWF